MSEIKKTDHFYLIDGSGYIFRAYYALPQLRKKDSSNNLEENKSLIFHGKLKLDPSQLECEWNGKPLPDKLTTTEFF